MISKVVVPNLGATGTDVTLVSWLVKTGDYVKAGSPLFSVSTDKAEMEVEAFKDGFLRQILADPGSVVELGEEVAIISDSLEESLPIVVRTSQSSTANRQTTQPKAQRGQETLLSSHRTSPFAAIQSPQDNLPRAVPEARGAKCIWWTLPSVRCLPMPSLGPIFRLRLALR